MKWTKKDCIQAITTLTDPFETQESSLDKFRKEITSPVPQLPPLSEAGRGNGEVKSQ